MPALRVVRGSMWLRYRFERLEDFVQHLHRAAQATFFFVSEPRLADPRVRSVLVEVSIRETRQQAVLRGEPAGWLEGAKGGWLRLSEHHLPRFSRPPGPFVARGEPRIAGEQRLRLRSRQGDEVAAQLLDLSPGGIRLHSHDLTAGETWLVRLSDVAPSRADLGPAQVLRSRSGEAGLRFSAPGNGQVLRFLGFLREAWLRAPDLQHRPECCKEGRPSTPPLPQLRSPAQNGSR